jgi:hypothetical protein
MVGPTEADDVSKLVATYRAACAYIDALDDRRNGDTRGLELARRETALRDAVWASVQHERIARAVARLGDTYQPDPEWQAKTWARIHAAAAQRPSCLRRLWNKVSW